MSDQLRDSLFEEALDRCDLARKTGSIAVFIIKDSMRETILRTVADRLRGTCLSCARLKSASQFTRWLTDALGIPHARDSLVMRSRLCEWLAEQGRITILDNAHVLTPRSLRILLGLHKSMNDGRRNEHTAFALASGSQQLLKRIDAVDEDASFTSHCMYYLPHGSPTKPMLKQLEVIEGLMIPPPIPFSRNEGHE